MLVIEAQDQESLLQHSLVSKEDDVEKVFSKWYLDTGASNHMTGHEEFFTYLNKDVGGKVRFGDGSVTKISGEGSVIF